MATKKELEARIAVLEEEVAVLRRLAIAHNQQPPAIVPIVLPPQHDWRYQPYPGTWPEITCTVATGGTSG